MQVGECQKTRAREHTWAAGCGWLWVPLGAATAGSPSVPARQTDSKQMNTTADALAAQQRSINGDLVCALSWNGPTHHWRTLWQRHGATDLTLQVGVPLSSTVGLASLCERYIGPL
jgi:hypothetical protein